MGVRTRQNGDVTTLFFGNCRKLVGPFPLALPVDGARSRRFALRLAEHFGGHFFVLKIDHFFCFPPCPFVFFVV
jgi:hypothetical protein